jgi:hypothetical protein
MSTAPIGLSPEIREAARAKHRALQQESPALTFIPNIGQERMLRVWARPHRPFIGVIGAGNGMGKTSLSAPMMVGCAFGPDEVSEWMEQIPMWQQEQDKRLRRGTPLQYRIVCHADGMKENGPMLSAIKEWFPKGRYKLDKAGKTYISQVLCFDEHGEVCAVFDVKTHDQEKTAHAGANLDGVFVDEPMPQELYTETVGRCRKDGAFIAMFLTPLEVAGWMMDQIIDDADDREIVVVTGSLWDNCRDIPGTRGHLSREVIERQIREWEKTSPHELEARVYGTFTHLSGALFKNYSTEIHEVDEFPIPPHWPIYCIIDPHDSKAPFVTWFAQGEHEAYAIREWPMEDYTKLGENTMTITQVVGAGREIEKPFRSQLVWRFMDPNKGKTPHRGVTETKTVQEEYREAGWEFELSEDDLQVGHERIRTALHYDMKRPVDESNRPYLRVFRCCPNTSKSLARYGMKKDYKPGSSLTASIDKKYKDPVDNVRYFLMRLQPFQRVEAVKAFYSDIMSGRVRK